MKKISSIIQHFKSNPLTRLEKDLLLTIVIAWFSMIGIIILLNHNRGQLTALKNQNNQTIKQSEKVILLQQKEIEKLKKDVVLHTIIADSSIAKANRISKKTILNQIEYEKISINVSAFDDSDIIKFWASHKKR